MSITDELREWVVNTFYDNTRRMKARIIADRIDAAHEKACAEAWDNGYEADYLGIEQWLTEHPQVMEHHGWVQLPKDADGEVIHVGDTVRWGDAGEPFEVKAIIYRAGCETEVGNGEQYGEVVAIGCHHYHAPTVEDVLREFANRWWTLPREESADELLADFAQRLQLREDE